MHALTATKMLADVICSTFMKDCGKFQANKPEAERKAFLVEFRLPTDYAKEEGYRHLEMIIWGALNYVQVWTRETWDVIPIEDMEYNEGADESIPKPGKDYQQGASEWKLISDHDSGWRDGVTRVLRENEKISGLGSGDWFKLVLPPTEIAK